MAKKIRTADDLDKLRNRVKGELDIRESDKDMCIIVHMGTCGIAAGARDVLTEVISGLDKASLKNVAVKQTTLDAPASTDLDGGKLSSLHQIIDCRQWNTEIFRGLFDRH